MLMTHDELVELFDQGAIRCGRRDAIGGSSIDIHLGDTILIESAVDHVVDYRARTPLQMTKLRIPDEGFVLRPGDFILAHSVESLTMPLDVSALLRTKSSMGRIGFEHMDAGWVDPGFFGALTLEYTNQLRHQSIRLRAGDPVGQLVFFRGAPVRDEDSYMVRGRYNGSTTVEQVR